MIVLPIQFIINSIPFNIIILLLYLPIILLFISTYYALKIFEKRNLLTLNGKELFNNYADSSKEDFLMQVSSNLSVILDINYYYYDEHNYSKSLDKSLTFFKWGIIALIIVSAVLVFSYYI